jgi:hypothetical protein
MASTRRKSAAIALAVVGIAGLSLASAATLNINSNSLAAGTINVSGCDDAVDVDYTTVYNAGTKTYDVSAVVVSDIAAICFGANPSQASITLVSGATTTTVASNVTLTAASQTFTLGTAIPSAPITDIAIVFAG